MVEHAHHARGACMSLTEQRRVQRWPGKTEAIDALAHEAPMEIRVDGQPLAVVLRTPGHDLDLAAGFLYTEGIVDGADDIVAIAHVDDPQHPLGNTVDVKVAGGVTAHAEAIANATRELYATSSCGICGKAAIDRIHVFAPPLPERDGLNPAFIADLPRRMTEHQSGFAATGGLHAAALFDLDGNLTVLREDIGRHNAVDKVLGHRLRRDNVPTDDQILVVSSRAGFEIAQKALVARARALVCVGAASTMAVDLAASGNLPLYGFVRQGRLTRYV